MQLKRNWLIGMLTFGMVTPCLADPIGTPFTLPIALTAESLIVALLVIPIGLRFTRIFFTWVGITTASWVLMILCMSAMDILLSDASVVAPIIAELCIVVAEAWLLTWISGCAYFHKVETKTLKYVPPSEYFRQPEVRRLSWGGALAISFLANGTSLLIGFL